MPSGRTLVVVAAVVVSAAIAAVALAPAALIDPRIADVTGGAVRLTGASGSVWRGHGILAAGATRLPIAWRVDAWGLARGELRVVFAGGLDGTSGTPHGKLTFGSGRVAIADLDVTLPATLVAQLGAPLPPMWSLDGEIGLRIAAMDWAPPESRGVALLSWRGARVAGAGLFAPLDLGAVTATLTANGDRLSGPVASAGGDLAISGVLDARAHDRLRATLALSPTHRDDVALTRLLSAVAGEDATGWHVDWSVPLR